MADEPSGTKRSPELPPALDDRELSIVGDANDKKDKKEVEVFLADIEANLRELDKWVEDTKAHLAIAGGNSDGGMTAIFAAADRVLERAGFRAPRVEAEDREHLIQDERGETSAQEASELEGRRGELDRVASDQQVADESVVQRIVEIEAAEQDGSERSRDEELPADDDNGSERRTRYERKSAKLPSMGDDASRIIGSLKRLREKSRGA